MKHQFTITVDTPDVTMACLARDEAVGAIEDFTERRRPSFGIECGQLIETGASKDQAPIAAARIKREDEGEIEFDDNPKVAHSNGGAYVAAWVWVNDNEIADAELSDAQSTDTVDSEGGHCD